MAMPTVVSSTDWTVDMLDALPDDGQRYEIIDGELFVTPSPGEGHQDVVGLLYARLLDYLARSDVGKAVSSPSDVRRGDRTRNRLQPDVYVVRRENGKRPPYPYDLADLLLAVEVLSPSTARTDHHRKRTTYLTSGVAEYWVVDVEGRTVSRWRRATDPGELLTERLEWHPAGMAAPFVIELPAFFDEALR